MDESLCLETFESADVKYHSTVVFPSSSPKIPKSDKLDSKFKKVVLQEVLHSDKLNAKVKHDNSFSNCSLKIVK